MSELKCCPFCGGKAKIVKYCGKKTIVYVECTNCLAYMGNQRIMASSSRGKEYFESEDRLINAWNARTPMANIVEKLKEKTEFLKDCTKYGNESAEQQEKSYSTMMMYEVADLVDDLIDIVKQEINNGLE